MPQIEIKYFTGDVEERALTKTQPLSIGRHPSNDVCINEDDVAVMHCRISWNRDQYEVVAANPEGVEVNGALVRNASLDSGDVLRIGTVDITFRLEDPDEPSRASGRKAAAAAGGGDSEAEMLATQDIVELQGPGDEPEFLDEPEFVEDDPAPRRPAVSRRTPAAEDEDYAFDEEPKPQRDRIAADVRDGSGADDSLTARIRASLRSRPVRPGEQDVVRSKFVLGLVGGALVLMLTAVVIWAMTLRTVSQKLYDAAADASQSGKYSQSIELFVEFLQKYPRSDLADQAHFGLGRARVEKEIRGASPNWTAGLEAADDFILKNRDREGYSEQQEALLGYARDIALGAAKSAETDKKRELLETAERAKNLARTLGASAEFEGTFKEAYRTAEAALRKYEGFNEAVAGIQQAIKDKDPMLAIQRRLDLLQRYQTFTRSEEQQLARLLADSLEAERSLITVEALNRDALAEDRPEKAARPLSLALHVRPRTGETSAGNRLVFAVARNCCYAVEAVLGTPVWRRVVGFDAPFFPIEVETTVPGLLLYDTDNGELVLVNRLTGELLWRQPLRTPDDELEQLHGPPLVHEGQIYVPTLANHLYKLDLHSGRVSTRLRFSQEVLAPPVLVAEGERLVVAGDKALAYTLTLAPFECESVIYLGHRPGSVVAPLVSIGRLLLMCENDREGSCRLRVFNSKKSALEAKAAGRWLAELTPSEEEHHIRVDGHVRDAPQLRLRNLFVVSSGERVTVFTVSDDDKPPQKEDIVQHYLRRLARFPEQTGHRGPTFLTAGPNDQFWVSGSRLRKFELKTETIQLDPRETTVGLSTQPPQVIGQNLYIGRRLPYSSAVTFTLVDRDQMQGQWRAVLGAEVLAWTAGEGKPLICITEEGDLFRVSSEELQSGGFKTDGTAALRPLDGIDVPLRATELGDGRVAVHSGGTEPHLWLVNELGQIERRIRLPEPLEADPVLLSAGIVLPVAGELQMVRLSAGGGRVGAFQRSPDNAREPDAEDRDDVRWTHLAALDGEQLVAASSDGTLVRVQLRMTSGSAHLAKAGQERKLPHPVDYGFVVHGGNIVVADAGGALHVLDPSTMETLAEAKLDGPATNSLWLIGDTAYVETEYSRLSCFRVGATLEKLWSTPLGDGLAGRPVLVGGSLTIARRDGGVWSLDPASGEKKAALDLGEPLALAPKVVDDSLVVPSTDGSLHVIRPEEAVRQAER